NSVRVASTSESRFFRDGKGVQRGDPAAARSVPRHPIEISLAGRAYRGANRPGNSAMDMGEGWDKAGRTFLDEHNSMSSPEIEEWLSVSDRGCAEAGRTVLS